MDKAKDRRRRELKGINVVGLDRTPYEIVMALEPYADYSEVRDTIDLILESVEQAEKAMVS